MGVEYITSRRGTARNLITWGAIKSATQAARPERLGKIVFQTDGIRTAAIVFVEFVADKTGHEFHELTRIKFSTVFERVEGRMN